jgi:hypothetical protein
MKTQVKYCKEREKMKGAKISTDAKAGDLRDRILSKYANVFVVLPLNQQTNKQTKKNNNKIVFLT